MDEQIYVCFKPCSYRRVMIHHPNYMESNEFYWPVLVSVCYCEPMLLQDMNVNFHPHLQYLEMIGYRCQICSWVYACLQRHMVPLVGFDMWIIPIRYISLWSSSFTWLFEVVAISFMPPKQPKHPGHSVFALFCTRLPYFLPCSPAGSSPRLQRLQSHPPDATFGRGSTAVWGDAGEIDHWDSWGPQTAAVSSEDGR